MSLLINVPNITMTPTPVDKPTVVSAGTDADYFADYMRNVYGVECTID